MATVFKFQFAKFQLARTWICTIVFAILIGMSLNLADLNAFQSAAPQPQSAAHQDKARIAELQKQVQEKDARLKNQAKEIADILKRIEALASEESKDEIIDPRYNALCWVQKSAEYHALAKQTYRFAAAQLLIGMNDSKWSADEVQVSSGGYETKPPAVILDADETVLDNSAYNARNIVDDEPYSTESWNAWCNEEKADAIPGALEFTKMAKAIEVEVFFVTNRHDDVRTATLNNLKSLGFPVDEDHLLTKNSDLGRDGNKISRRAMVAQNHRIILLIGDNLSDLFSGLEGLNTQQRNEISDNKNTMLGSRWIVMPNPVYGSWQRALPPGKEALDLKR